MTAWKVVEMVQIIRYLVRQPYLPAKLSIKDLFFCNQFGQHGKNIRKYTMTAWKVVDMVQVIRYIVCPPYPPAKLSIKNLFFVINLDKMGRIFANIP